MPHRQLAKRQLDDRQSNKLRLNPRQHHRSAEIIKHIKESIYEDYRDQGFTILDFPCNQFGGQAPGDYDDIHNFCTSTYNITFPQFAKIDVNGPNASPLYKWLKEKKPCNIQWNFTKFLVDREGNVLRRFEPNTSMTIVRNAVRDQL